MPSSHLLLVHQHLLCCLLLELGASPQMSRRSGLRDTQSPSARVVSSGTSTLFTLTTLAPFCDLLSSLSISSLPCITSITAPTFSPSPVHYITHRYCRCSHPGCTGSNKGNHSMSLKQASMKHTICSV